MDFEAALKNLKNTKTNKTLNVRFSVNDWLCQVVVDNKVWSSVYHSFPPFGTPKFVADSVQQAKEMVYEKRITQQFYIYHIRMKNDSIINDT